MFGSPKFTLTTLPFSFFTYTENFFGPPEVLKGLFKVFFSFAAKEILLEKSNSIGLL
jgi:hypothetical protein